LTASHNPGGIDYDFGIKYNCANGGPAPSSITDKIYEISKDIVEFKAVQTGFEKVDLGKLGTTSFTVDGEPFDIEIVDSTDEYFKLMKEIFDLDAIGKYLNSSQRVSFILSSKL
jgi:phosphoglucomutase